MFFNLLLFSSCSLCFVGGSQLNGLSFSSWSSCGGVRRKFNAFESSSDRDEMRKEDQKDSEKRRRSQKTSRRNKRRQKRRREKRRRRKRKHKSLSPFVVKMMMTNLILTLMKGMQTVGLPESAQRLKACFLFSFF